MEFASPSVRIFARFHYFLPALALCTAGAYFGGYGGASIIYLSHALFGWGAYAALARGEGAGAALGQRVPGQLLLLLLIALMGALLLGVPAALALRQPGWVTYAVVALCALILLIGGARFWAAPGVIFGVQRDALMEGPLQQTGLAARTALELTRGHIERSIEGTPLLAALLTLLLLPFALLVVGLTPADRLYWGLLGAAALFSPLVHGYLIAEVRQLLSDAPSGSRPAAVSAPVGLVEAARSGDLAHLRMLVEDSRSGEALGGEAVFAALEAPARLRPDVLGLLLDHGAPTAATDHRGMTALHCAARNNDIRSIELLLNAGADAEARDREGRTALAAACEQAHWGAARTLLKLGADPAGGSMPPLHAAAICAADEPAGVELLRNHGAEIDVRGKLGRTALMGAAMRGNALIVSALLDAGADINARDNFGNTALMEAARAGANGVLERLSSYQPETESRDKPGRTALLVAVSSRRADPDTIRLLLGLGADPSVRNREGRDAAELAVSAGRWRIARALGVQGGPVPDDGTSPPAPARVTARIEEEATRVIDLGLFETAEDRDWAARQMEKRSRTQLESATVQMEAVQLGDPPPPPQTATRRKAAAAKAQTELPLNGVAELTPEAVAAEPSPRPVPTPVGPPTASTPAAPAKAAAPVVDDPIPDQIRAGYQTLLQAARRDDLQALQMVLETEEEIPEWWLVSAFLSSVAAGCAIAPRWLLEHGLNPNAHNEAGVPLLSSIAQQAPANLQVLEDLLAQGARADTDQELLHWLSGRADSHAEPPASPDEEDERRLPDLLDGLLAGGGQVDSSDDEGRTPLHWAAVHRSLPYVERLLSAGAPVDVQDRSGNTALMLAVVAERTGVARALIKAGADARIANAKGTSPMSVAMDRREPTLSKVLMSGKPSPLKPPDAEPTPADLIRAATEGKLGRVKRFIGRGVAIDARDEQGCSALLRAAGEGHADVVSALLSAGANPAVTSRNRTTPLGAAVLGNHIEVIKVLCDRGVDANQRQQYGITPLMLAAARWQPRATSTLLGFDADPNARDDTEGTPLMAAVQNALSGGDIDAGAATIKMLVKSGADVNAANDEGQTPLMLLLGVRARANERARETDLMRIGNILLEAGAEIDRQDLTGWSALHAAAAHGFRDAAALLMDRGASRRLRDINGLSPVDLAMDNAHDALVDLFIERA